MILQSKLALEQIALRMRTSTELGDVAASLLPVVNAMNDLKTGIASISPQTEKSLGNLSDLLSGMVVNAGLVNMDPISLDSVNEDTSQILGEAQIVAENRINETFPRTPRKTSDNYLGEDNSKP